MIIDIILHRFNLYVKCMCREQRFVRDFVIIHKYKSGRVILRITA